MPTMLIEIVTRLVDEQEDMESLSIENDDTALEQRISDWRPDIVLLSCACTEIRKQSRALLNLLPNLRVLALTSNGREATLSEYRVHETRLGTVSPKTLIETIRDTATNRAGHYGKNDAETG